jgi:hypothetical protein
VVDALARMLNGLDGEQPAVVDLSGCTLHDYAASRRLLRAVNALIGRGEVISLSCRRPGGRSELDTLGAAGIPVFGSVGDALLCHRLRADGYGPGWTPTVVSTPDRSHGPDLREAAPIPPGEDDAAAACA